MNLDSLVKHSHWVLKYATVVRIASSDSRIIWHPPFVTIKIDLTMTAEAEKWKQLPEEHVARSTKLPWYHDDFEYKLKPTFRKLLEEWSGIPPDDVVPHIYQVVGPRPDAHRAKPGSINMD